jgi:hypothetical protein
MRVRRVFEAIGDLVIRAVRSWFHGCAMVGACRCAHLRAPDDSSEREAALG